MKEAPFYTPLEIEHAYDDGAEAEDSSGAVAAGVRTSTVAAVSPVGSLRRAWRNDVWDAATAALARTSKVRSTS
jgi:hypothetical protein